MNNDLSNFLASFNISEKDFESTNLKWDDLQSISKDYKKIRKELDIIARYIEEKLYSSNIVHLVRYRIKDSKHLIAKIIRKKIKDPANEITIHNYKSSITDLIGIRVIHLFKEDWVFIHKFIEESWNLHEQPLVYIREGDAASGVDEYKKNKCKVELHPQGYRSIHYLIKSSLSKDSYFAEIQVRTIFEEGWSEIDHAIRYPNNIDDPLLNKFLDTFNVSAGNSDQMGSFVRNLKKDLLKGTEKIEGYEKITEQNTEIISDLRKRIVGTVGGLNSKMRNVELKIESLASNEIAPESFLKVFDEVKTASSKFELVMASNPQEAVDLLKSSEQKLERLEKLLEMTIAENDDIDNDEEEEAESYKNHTTRFVDNLKILAEFEGGVVQETLISGHGQDDSLVKIENALKEINSRDEFTKFLIGPKYRGIESLKAEMIANQTRIKTLTDAINLVTDLAVSFVLQRQINLFVQQNDKLQVFVAKSEQGVSLFGWVLKLFI